MSTLTSRLFYLRNLVVFWVCFTLAGCIMLPVPTPENKVLSGQPVSDSQLNFMTPGISTQAEIIEYFGVPNILWEDENVFVYQWEMRQGILLWAVGGGYQAAAGREDIPKHYLLLMQFNEQGTLLRYEKIVRPLTRPYAEFLKEWIDRSNNEEAGQ